MSCRNVSDSVGELTALPLGQAGVELHFAPKSLYMTSISTLFHNNYSHWFLVLGLYPPDRCSLENIQTV